MIAGIQTSLRTTAANALKSPLQRDAFLYITHGMPGFKGAKDWPEAFEEGQKLKTKLLLFSIVPAWEHVLRIIRIDHENMELASQEEGGFIKC